MDFIKAADEESDFYGDQLAEPKYIFDDVRSGLHEGYVVNDVGWAAFSIREALGIEPFVALASAGSEVGFFEWVKKVTKDNLTDWEPTTTILYQYWIPMENPMTEDMGPCCYRSWGRRNKHSDAVAIWPTRVFALRHKSWPILAEGRIREFHVRVQRSTHEARLRRDHPGKALTPADMKSDAGFVVYGCRDDQSCSSRLTWATADLYQAISEADSVLNGGATKEVEICGDSIALPYTAQNRARWVRMAQLDRYQGGYIADLVGLAREVGGLD